MGKLLVKPMKLLKASTLLRKILFFLVLLAGVATLQPDGLRDHHRQEFRDGEFDSG